MTGPAHVRAQKPVRVNREEPPGDLKEYREPTVNPTLLGPLGRGRRRLCAPLFLCFDCCHKS